ncbi:MAG: AAA family ATPase [Candidatus Eremiobacteraeota bacterium]|nr:AAA family ATPase [Candidatus Eremiobacteraeota bacterium]
MPLLFDERSNTVHSEARKISSQAGHFYVGAEHLALAAVEVDMPLRNALTNLGLDKNLFREKVIELATPGDKDCIPPNPIESPRYKKVLRNCEKVAISTKSYRIEPAHIFITILQERRGVTILALNELGFDSAACETSLIEAFKGGVFSGSVSPGAHHHHKAAEKKDEKKEPKLLAQYARNLIELARSGKMDPVVGRNDEIRRVLQIITRKGKNNPVLIGEAGVGKTAVIFGLAQRIAEGKVPDMIKDRILLDLPMASIVAGAKHRGEFEERLQQIMKEVSENPDIIIFIDEIHTIVGAGDSKGGMDAGNILKPMLARGEFPVIGATTIDEYRKYIETDPALERRFQPVLVNEPSEEDTLLILKGLLERYEKHHGVKFTDKALLAAVKLSVRYLPDRNLPDKAIDLIDEAAAKVRMRSVSISDGESPTFEVNDEAIAEVVALWTGIPVSKLTSEEKERLLNLEEHMKVRVVGQDEAVKIVAQTIRMVRMGLGNPNRPGGIFLFLGPTGVGKTELAKTLADFMFGSEKEMIRLDMSEYMEKHAISRLIGSPPGYVGHDEEGQLTKAVRTKPYSVVLLDEVEKAHPEVFDLFLQVFDDGRLTDAKGRTVNFTNTIIILTSNIGTSKVDKDGNTRLLETGDPQVREEVFKELRKAFRPEFINRIDEIIIFNPLGRESLKNIVEISIREVMKRVKEKGITLDLEESAYDLFLRMGYNPAYGARPLKRAIQTYLSKPLAEKMLTLGEAFTGTILVRAPEGEERVEFEVLGEPAGIPAGTIAGEGEPQRPPGGLPGDLKTDGGTMIGGPDEG